MDEQYTKNIGNVRQNPQAFRPSAKCYLIFSLLPTGQTNKNSMITSIRTVLYYLRC